MNLNLGGGNTISPLYPQPLSSFPLTSPPSPFFSPTWLTPLPHPVSCWNDDEHKELLSTFSLTPNTLLKQYLCFLSCTLLVKPSRLHPSARPPPPPCSVWILPNLPRPSRPASNTLPLLLCCGQCTASPFPRATTPTRALLRWTHCTLNQARLLLVHPVWRCEAGLCDALTPVIVSPKCKAVAPSCGQVFSWEFYSGTVPGSFPQVHTTDGGIQTVLAMGDPDLQSLTRCFSGPGCPVCPASAL